MKEGDPIYPVTGIDTQVMPHHQIAVLQLKYTGRDATGALSEVALPPLGLTAAGCRALSERLAHVAVELEQSTPIAPSASAH